MSDPTFNVFSSNTMDFQSAPSVEASSTNNSWMEISSTSISKTTLLPTTCRIARYVFTVIAIFSLAYTPNSFRNAAILVRYCSRSSSERSSPKTSSKGVRESTMLLAWGATPNTPTLLPFSSLMFPSMKSVTNFLSFFSIFSRLSELRP